MKFHIISGLPRSGSTLLAALLRQNPRFHAAMSSPVQWLLKGMLEQMSANSTWRDWYTEERRARILRGIVENYYDPEFEFPVIFDTGHTWTGKLPLLHELFPAAKVICCVRDIPSILNSVERVLRQNPLQAAGMFGFKLESSVYARVRTMMGNPGFLGPCWESLREAWYGPFREKLIMVEYNDLVRTPAVVLREIYHELNEPAFEHDFEHFDYEETELDRGIGMPGMHQAHGPVWVNFERVNYLPPDIVAEFANTDFWRTHHAADFAARPQVVAEARR